MASDLECLVCADDFEVAAKEKLDKSSYDYFRSGADQELTLRRNIAAFERYLIRARVLRDVSQVDTTVTLLANVQLSYPIGIAATAFHKLAHPDAEQATARAAEKTNTLMIASSIATTRMEDIANAAPLGLRWFQAYIYKDRQATRTQVQRAERVGYTALVLTVDMPLVGKRRPGERNNFQAPRIANFEEAEGSYDLDPSLTWLDVRWLVDMTSLPVLIKGILTKEDALLAYQHGAKAIIVSNHGARQLDSVPATMEALSEVAQTLEGLCDVYLDGGIRTGTDILKAIALGARTVFIGRPVIWALAAHGEEGVVKLLRLLQDEFLSSMKLAGVRSIKEINRSLVVHEDFYSKL